MPGERLTPQDRRDIAAWLAEGLTYTTMAARLRRPKSTIAREVARNGGRADYRAEYAQRLTRARARRRKPAPRVALPEKSEAHGRDPEAVLAYQQRLAEASARTGAPRMVARVLAVLFTTDSGRLSSAELVRRLRVSPAAISTAVAWAERQGLIFRQRGPRGKQMYTIESHVGNRSLVANIDGNTLLAEISRQGAEILGPDTPAGARLDKVGEFLSLITRDLADSVEKRSREVFGD